MKLTAKKPVLSRKCDYSDELILLVNCYNSLDFFWGAGGEEIGGAFNVNYHTNPRRPE